MISEQGLQRAYGDTFNIFWFIQFHSFFCLNVKSGQSQCGWLKDSPQNQIGARATIKKLTPDNVIQLNTCKGSTMQYHKESVTRHFKFNCWSMLRCFVVWLKIWSKIRTTRIQCLICRAGDCSRHWCCRNDWCRSSHRCRSSAASCHWHSRQRLCWGGPGCFFRGALNFCNVTASDQLQFSVL